MTERLLEYRQLGEQGPALICLHGLYGYGRNWNSLARQLASQYQVILPDLRNHGKSFHDPEWTYSAMASDLQILAEHLGLTRFSLLGHSMGGKVAMQYALNDTHNSLERLIIVDIAPRPYNPTYHQKLLTALSQLDLTQLDSREQADQQLSRAIPEAGVRSFLLSNLIKSDQNWAWQFNLPVLHERIELITENLDTSSGPFNACPVMFLAGADSDYVRPEDKPAILEVFPQASCEWIPDSGHWVHVDQPQILLERVKDFLP